MNISFISIKGSIVYIGYTVDVSRGMGNQKVTELLIFGCRRDKIPDKFKKYIEPYKYYYQIYKRF